MASPSRDEFLSYVHAPRRNPDGDPPRGSPTKSTMRYRWRELRPWAFEQEAREYWDGLPNEDKAQMLPVAPGFWDVIENVLRSYVQPLMSEPALKHPFNIAFLTSHNLAIQGAGDAHAEMWAEGSRLAKEPLGNADFIMVHDGKLGGLIELKTWWKVTDAEIEDVRAGPPPFPIHFSNNRPRTY